MKVSSVVSMEVEHVLKSFETWNQLNFILLLENLSKKKAYLNNSMLVDAVLCTYICI